MTPSRRAFLASLLPPLAAQQAGSTRFQIACMTLPYAAHAFQRALTGIRGAGYRFAALGTTHERKPLIDLAAPASSARSVASQCRNEGLEPVMMFSTVGLEAETAAQGHLRRIEHAAAAGIPFLLTFGRTEGGQLERVIATLRTAAPAARDARVTIVIKQHGGNTATGTDCVRILEQVGHESVKICYDAGNVLDYENQDPIPDIQKCAAQVRAFAIKDHRNFPKDEDCGPGYGEIDHYKLLMPVARTGLTMPLACENIFEPLVPRPAEAAAIDQLARRSREFLETVIRGIQS